MNISIHKSTSGGKALAAAAQAVMGLRAQESGEYPESVNNILGAFSEHSVRSQALDVNGVHCEWYTPEGAPEDRVVFYLHGGAYAAGHGVVYFAGSWLAASLGLRVLAVDYRLSGEAPFPAALEDSMTAYEWLLGEGYEQENITMLGDSAGGGLTLATAMKRRDEGKDNASSLVLISPWCDLTCSGESFKDTKDNILNHTTLVIQAAAYAGAAPLTNKYVSPLYGAVNDLPQTLIIAGTREALMSDSMEMAKKLDGGGCRCELHLWEGLQHDFAITMPFLKDSAGVFTLVKDYIDRIYEKTHESE